MQGESSLISVIVPVYNGQDYLEDCIRSIEEQTYHNLEIIIVNDGSSDGTEEVCEKLHIRYDNVRILTPEDAGVSAARNAGIDAARGTLITFVDADDRICCDMLQILYDCMQNAGSDVAGCRFFTWSSETEWKKAAGLEQTVEPDRTDGTIAVYDAREYLKEQILSGNSRCWSKLYRREVFDQIRFPKGLSIGEDMLFLVRMTQYTTRIAEIDYQGYGYYYNPEGAMNREFTPRYMDQVTCWELAREEVLKMDESLDARVTAHWITGIMLAAGKIAAAPTGKRHEYTEYTNLCHKKLQEAVRVRGAYRRLSAGYRLKVGMFLVCPSVYLSMYHLGQRCRQTAVRQMAGLTAERHFK